MLVALTSSPSIVPLFRTEIETFTGPTGEITPGEITRLE